MKLSDKGYTLLEASEGCVLTAYPDPATHSDPWTIGVGHTGPEVHKGLVWTKEQAIAALKLDVAKFEKQLDKLLSTAPTTQNQYDALIIFMFNVGTNNLKSSTLLNMHRAGNYDGAYKEFGRWNKANGHVMQGLTTRRAVEAKLYKGE